jgi:hypothetical protein
MISKLDWYVFGLVSVNKIANKCQEEGYGR